MTRHSTDSTGEGSPSLTTKRRRPVEAIEKRTLRSVECEKRVLRALTKLTKMGIPFTVKEVCDIAGVGKTFIYDRRHPELTRAILDARNASQLATTIRAEESIDGQTSSWRERACNAEAHAKRLKADLAERDSRIADLIGQLQDPDGTHLLEENARLRGMLAVANRNAKD